MSTTQWLLVLIAYVIGPIFIGWTVTIPKGDIPSTSQYINIFYGGVFIMFFILGCLLRYHLGATRP